MKYQSLLVSLDGSSFAEQALPLALSIARRAGASLRLVRIHVRFNVKFAYTSTPFFAFGAEANCMEQERAYLDDVVLRLAGAGGVPIEAALVEGECIAEMLDKDAQMHGVDLIVMTTHGRGPSSRFWLGSVADELLRRASVPLLLVRPQDGVPDLAQEAVLRHILIPLDGSELAEQILEPAVALGSLMQADYQLVRVCSSLGEKQPTDAPECAAQGGPDPFLESVAERLRAEGRVVRTHAIQGQHAAAAILREAQELGSDLIALETHGRFGLNRWLLGSIADKVVRQATTPVLVQQPRCP